MNKVREMYPQKQKAIHRDQLVTVGDLEEFKTEILLSIRNLLNEYKTQNGKKWLKSYEVRQILDISPGTMQTLRNNGSLPFTKLGGTIYYNSDDIDKLLLALQRQFKPGH